MQQATQSHQLNNNICDQENLAEVIYFCKDLINLAAKKKNDNDEERLMSNQLTILLQALHEFGDKRNILDSDCRKMLIDNLILLKNKV